MRTTHGTVHWSELMTRDAEAACDFYGKICGWSFEKFPAPEGAPPYHVAMSNGQPAGGILEMSGPDFEGQPTQWMTYLHVDDVDAACAEAEAMGGTVLMPCFDMPMVGRIAKVKDSTSGVIGLITPAEQG